MPKCEHNQKAEVQQSREEETAGRAFYKCAVKEVIGDHWKVEPCKFFKWIDGPEAYDPRIRLFSWRPDVTTPYHQFNRWVPPPPNPPEMTEAEKAEASARLEVNPPLCHCNYRSMLLRPNHGVEFIPFFRCALNSSDGWPLCDFQEYIYGPKSLWPSMEEVEEFNAGTKKWPCDTRPPYLCKCGIEARRGVVPSELGYGGTYMRLGVFLWQKKVGRGA